MQHEIYTMSNYKAHAITLRGLLLEREIRRHQIIEHETQKIADGKSQ